VPTKREYEEFLNELLGLEVKWSKLSKEELAAIATLFSNPAALLERLGYSTPDRIRDELVQRATDRILSGRGPLITLIRSILLGEGEKREREG